MTTGRSERRALRPWRNAAIIAAVTVLLAGCGGSGKTETVVVETATQSQNANTTASGGKLTPFYMPASATATTCTAYLAGHDALLEYASNTFNVAHACQQWIRNNATQGSLWTEQTPADGIPFDDAQVCALTNAQGDVTASVLDDGDQVHGQSACEGLLAAGWVDQNAPATQPDTNSQPVPGAPKLIVSSPGTTTFSGIEPSEMDFSGDAGNVVTDIIWSSWTQTQAAGQGTSNLQNCVPNCAQGTDTPVATTITLLGPQAGHFTQIVESRNGLTSDGSYGSQAGWPLQAATRTPG